MISFGTRTLPTSCSSAANSSVAPLAGAELELVRDAHRELDDVAAVHAGVGVVGLDHVAEQERRAAVGVAQLELVVDPHPALAREDREQRRSSGSARRTPYGDDWAAKATASPIGARPASIT